MKSFILIEVEFGGLSQKNTQAVLFRYAVEPKKFDYFIAFILVTCKIMRKEAL